MPPACPPLRAARVDGLPSIVAVAQSIAVAQNHPPMNEPGRKTHGSRSPPFRCHWNFAFPSEFQKATKTPSQAQGPATSTASPLIGHRDGFQTRHRFRRCIVPGTTRQHANDNLTALPDCRPFQPTLPREPARLLLAALSQTAAFQSPGRFVGNLKPSQTMRRVFDSRRQAPDHQDRQP